MSLGNGSRGGIGIKTDEELALMEAAGRVVAQALSEMEKAVAPGVTTMELDAIAVGVCRDMGATPSFLGYRGYPAAICASANEVVIHGIPNSIPLKEGDVIGLDFGAMLNGWHADSALTVPVGRINPEAQRLLTVTEDALWMAVKMVKPGAKLNEISAAIQRHCERAGYSVVREMVGHGIGRNLHEEPDVPNYGHPGGRGVVLRKGMTFCIEPMINQGARHVATLPDKWTIVTTDGKPSAHFEHTVAVTSTGVKVLTLRPGQVDRTKA